MPALRRQRVGQALHKGILPWRFQTPQFLPFLLWTNLPSLASLVLDLNKGICWPLCAFAKALTVNFFFLLLYAMTLLPYFLTPCEFKTVSGYQNFSPAPTWAYHIAASFFLLDFTVHLNGPSYPVEFSRTLEQLMGFRDLVKTFEYAACLQKYWRYFIFLI